MVVTDFEVSTADRVRARATFVLESSAWRFPSTGTRELEVWFDWPAAYATPDEPPVDAFAVLALPVALATGERLRIERPVSGRLLLNLLEAASVYRSYFPRLVHPVEIEADSRSALPAASRRIGSFYSGGVDSLYNIAEMRRLDRAYGTGSVTDLWLVHGMDIELDDTDLWDATKGQLAPLANELGFRVADVRTNARASQQALVEWTRTGFGSVLGSVAKLFAPEVPLALIGSWASYENVTLPHASTPLVDPLWSCDAQSVRHFTARASRQDKLDTIMVEAPEFLQILRVCYKNPSGAYNCGTCEKCLRTQCGLVVANPGADLSMFDVRLSSDALEGIDLPCEPDKAYAWDMWRDLASHMPKSRFRNERAAIARALRRNRLRCLFAVRSRTKRFLEQSPFGRRLLRSFRARRLVRR